MKNIFASKQVIIGILASVLVVTGLSFTIKMAWADEAPPQAVAEAESAIQSRQPDIAAVKADMEAENKRHEEAMDPLQRKLDSLKNSNAFDVGSMAPRGWTFDWHTNKAVKIPEGKSF